MALRNYSPKRCFTLPCFAVLCTFFFFFWIFLGGPFAPDLRSGLEFPHLIGSGVQMGLFLHGCYIRPGPDFRLMVCGPSDYSFFGFDCALFLCFSPSDFFDPLYDYDWIVWTQERRARPLHLFSHHMLFERAITLRIFRFRARTRWPSKREPVD